MLGRILKLLTRKKSPVKFIDLNRIQPVSPVFGLDRGTPIDRYYVEKFFNQNQSLIKGSVLEVGGTRYTRKFGGNKVEVSQTLHPVPESGASLIGDLTDTSTLPESKIDCFICSQTLNFIFDVQKAVKGIHYLLKPGGIVLATVAGISQISRYDMERWGDFWRFTTASIERLFTSVFKDDVSIQSCGNVLAATAFLMGIATEEIPQKNLLDVSDPDYQLLITILARKSA